VPSTVGAVGYVAFDGAGEGQDAAAITTYDAGGANDYGNASVSW